MESDVEEKVDIKEPPSQPPVKTVGNQTPTTSIKRTVENVGATDNDIEVGARNAACPACPAFVGLKTLFLPQVNKQSLFIYGSEVAVKNECNRQKQGGVWVIHPLSPIRHYYVMFMVLITFLNLISIPMEIAFSEEAHGIARKCWVGFNVFSDTLFIIDVALNFRMGIHSDDSEVAILDLTMIRNAYLKTWFFPDFISAFPIDLVIFIADHSVTTSLVAGKIMRILMFVRILSMIRLLRVSRLVRFFSELERVSNANFEAIRLFFRIICLFMMMFLLCHWNGCIQYFVPMLEEFPPDCWVRQENLMNSTVAEKYSFCIFRALSHMIGISYGSKDPPTGEVELWIVMTSMVSGALMYTVLVANAAAMMTNIDAPAKAYKNKVNHLEDYMAYRKLPKALRIRISDYYQSRFGGKWFDEKDILKLVSRSLKEEILTVMCGSLLNNTPMFQNCDVNFINAILLELQYEVFQEGDVIICLNAPGDRMFFIEHGQVIVEADTFQKELCDGDYFGEICLLTRGRRVATVRALTICQLFSLSVDSFNHVLQAFPEAKKDIEVAAAQRQEDLRMAKLQHWNATSDDSADA